MTNEIEQAMGASIYQYHHFVKECKLGGLDPNEVLQEYAYIRTGQIEKARFGAAFHIWYKASDIIDKVFGRMSKLCYQCSIRELDRLPNIHKHKAAGWQTDVKSECEMCNWKAME